ncbi:MAG: hypothetical protein EXR78_10115 [Deltaproteobacteria bacterium]|nr:hypothetical protein [Deltaproteobacteria bacterium]
MDNTNKTKLMLLSQIVGIKPAEIADAVGVSRPYLSRLIHEDAFCGSAEFWNALELKLATLVQNRRSRVFQTPATRLPEEHEIVS